MKYIIISIAIIVVAGIVIYFLMSGQTPSVPDQAATAQEPSQETPTPAAQNQVKQSQGNELKIEDEKVGTGAEAKPGTTVTVNYVGTLANGAKFDSSYDRGKAFVFPLGRGMVIRGWEQGIVGMKVGGKRKLTIPPALGYGEAGSPGAIPPNATLIFEVELLGVQ